MIDDTLPDILCNFNNPFPGVLGKPLQCGKGVEMFVYGYTPSFSSHCATAHIIRNKIQRETP